MGPRGRGAWIALLGSETEGCILYLLLITAMEYNVIGRGGGEGANILNTTRKYHPQTEMLVVDREGFAGSVWHI